ncbi:MAG: DUF4062 domain-containing protein [Pseudomonadota bacterium]
MHKRYQVFVSSTFEDLQEERAEVMQALLELDCIPAGMELFPAANEEQWEWIKRVIEDSDYYLVMVAGRYGQVHPEKEISYTEMEYKYAVEIGKPVVAFLHEDNEDIPLGKSEKLKKNQRKLEEFKATCKTRLCKFWGNPPDLGAKVSRSITQLIRHNPSPGWIKATMVDEAGLIDLERLRLENERLRDEIRSLSEKALITEDVVKFPDEPVKLEWALEKKRRSISKSGNKVWKKMPDERFSCDVSWKEVINAIFPQLVNEPIDFSQVR